LACFDALRNLALRYQKHSYPLYLSLIYTSESNFSTISPIYTFLYH
jgi:hypothetical protein